MMEEVQRAIKVREKMIEESKPFIKQIREQGLEKHPQYKEFISIFGSD